MTQFGRPISDVTNTFNYGGWADLDEVSASDSDFAGTNDNTTGQLEVALTSSLADPVSSTGHIVRVRLAKANTGVPPSTTGNTQNMEVTLYQGATLIATPFPSAAVGAWTQTDYTLTAGEANAITDYTDLRVRIDSPASGGGPSGNRRGGAVSWVVLELPDAPPATTVNAEVATGTGAANAVTTLLTTNAGVAAGTGLANDATAAVTANAGVATGTGAALDGTAGIEVNPGVAAGTGAALAPAAAITVNAEVAAGTGLANNATADTVNGGVAWGAWSPTWSNAVALITVDAGVATGVGTANQPSVAITANAEAATALGAAYDASGVVGAYAGLATGTGTAYDATITVSSAVTVNAEAATGVGQAYNATISTLIVPVADGGVGYFETPEWRQIERDNMMILLMAEG